MLSSKEVLLLKRIKEDSVYNNWFFKEAKDIKWFYPLKEEGYFSFERILAAPNVLDYLERISMQVTQDGKNEEYGKELLEIIDNIVKSAGDTKNHYVWWYSVKIVNNLPISILEKAFQDNYDFRAWIVKWTDPLGGDLAVSDIGKNLLGKFLECDSTIKYAEIIIDVITKVRPNEKEISSSGRESAILRWQPYWILDSFKKYNKKISSKCSIETILEIADKLKTALEYKQKDYYAYLEVEDNFYRIEVSRVFEEFVGKEEVAFKENVYSCSVNQYTKDQIEGADVKNNLWMLQNTDSPKKELKQFFVNSLSKEHFIAIVKSQLPGEVNWANCPDLDKKLGFLFDGLFDDHSYIWFKSLADNEHLHPTDAEEILIVILRDILLVKCQDDPVQGIKILEAFLTDKYRFSIFKRLVLFFSNQNWGQYGRLFSQFLKIKPNPLQESDYELEIYDVLLNQNAQFDDGLKKEIKILIDDVPEFYVEKGAKAVAHWQHRWLSPLKDNLSFTDIYRQAKETAEPKDGKDYEPDRSTFMDGLVVHKSSLSKDEILNKPISDLVEYLKEFKGADFWEGTFEGKPDKEGLAEALQASVKENPKRFTDEITLFNQNGLQRYVNAVLWGLRDAWRAGTSLDWPKVLEFCLLYIQSPSFMDESTSVQGEDSGPFKGKYIWLVDAVVDLIEDGSRDDKRSFENDNFEKVEQIFDTLLPYVKGEKKPDTQRSAINYAINTSLGKLIEAYIIFSLHVSRVHQKPVAWGTNKYERFFEKGIEAYIFLGRYILNLRHLDQEYVDTKIVAFTQEGVLDEFQWSMFMEGYLCSAHLPKHLYSAMRVHYLRALSYGDFEKRIEESLVEHLCFGYLYYEELLQEKNGDGQFSLFWKMLQEAGSLAKPSRWIRVAGFFWAKADKSLREDATDENKEHRENLENKILEFWSWTYRERDQVKIILGDKYGEFLGDIVKLTLLLKSIDDEKEQWILLAAPYVERYHESSFLIEYLIKFEDAESIKRIGKIYREILNYGTPIFLQENIVLLVDRIYKKGIWEDAEAICDTYGRRGTHFLKPVWEANQKNKQKVA